MRLIKALLYEALCHKHLNQIPEVKSTLDALEDLYKTNFSSTFPPSLHQSFYQARLYLE